MCHTITNCKLTSYILEPNLELPGNSCFVQDDAFIRTEFMIFDILDSTRLWVPFGPQSEFEVPLLFMSQSLMQISCCVENVQ
jgi:hypothetical protein